MDCYSLGKLQSSCLCGNMEVKLGMFVIQVTLSVNKLGSLLRDGDNEHCHGNIY